MIRMMTALTEEVDELDDGLEEILEQIDLKSLDKNSVGLITCHVDFSDTGFIKALGEKLPFDIIGMTTMAGSNKHGKSMYALSLTVLTSNDVVFKTVQTEALSLENYRDKIKASYEDSVSKLGGKPRLVITFLPFFKDLSGSPLHKCLDEVSGGVPIWGSGVCIDLNYERCFTIHNGNISKDQLVMVLLEGNVNPEFTVVSMPGKYISKTRGLITSSDGCTLRGINGISPVKYLESIGVNIMKDATVTIPMMVYYEGSTEPVASAVYSVHDDESFLCGAWVPEGASVAVGEITPESILSSAREGMDRILGFGKRDCVLIMPCVSRYIMLAPNRDEELDLIAEKLNNGSLMPFMAGYAGGEICPVRDENGIFKNRFHNFSFSACVL